MIAYAFDLEILNMRLHGAFLRYIFLEIGCMKDINGEELGKLFINFKGHYNFICYNSNTSNSKWI